MEADAKFYRRRLAEERRAMDEAHNSEAKALHRALADSYADKLRQLGELGEADDILPQD